MKTLLLIFVLALITGGAVYCWHHHNKILSGENWTAKQTGNAYVVSIANHAELVAALTDFVRQNRIRAGDVRGIGAVDSATLRFFNPATKKYVDKTFNGQMEITNLTGNISTMDGKEYLHLHITLGDNEYRALAGHLLSAEISGAGEFIVTKIPGTVLERTFSPEVGLNFYDFNKK